LQALEFIERGILADDVFKGLKQDSAAAVVVGASSAKRKRTAAAKEARESAKALTKAGNKAEAKKQLSWADSLDKQGDKAASVAGNLIADAIKSGDYTPTQARDLATAKDQFKTKKLPDISAASKRFCTDIAKLFAAEDTRRAKFNELAKFQDHLETKDHKEMRTQLTLLRDRIDDCISQMKEPIMSKKRTSIRRRLVDRILEEMDEGKSFFSLGDLAEYEFGKSTRGGIWSLMACPIFTSIPGKKSS